MATAVTYRDDEQLIFSFGFLQRLLPPRVPVYGVVGVLQKIRAGFVDEGVGVFVHVIWFRTTTNQCKN